MKWVYLILFITTLALYPSLGNAYQIPQWDLREFASEQELRDWVSANKLSVIVYSGQSFQGYADGRYDCDDYAEDLRRKAEQAGAVLNICPVNNGCVWGVKVSDVPGFHVGNWTRIGNTFYYVEPFPLKSNVVKIKDAD